MKIVAYINDILFYSHTCANSSTNIATTKLGFICYQSYYKQISTNFTNLLMRIIVRNNKFLI